MFRQPRQTADRWEDIMTDTTSDTAAASTAADRARSAELSAVGRFLKATEIDPRMPVSYTHLTLPTILRV